MKSGKRILSLLLAVVMVISMIPVHAHAAEADATLTASLAKAKSYIDGITINNSSNDPATVVKNFKTHFTWDNEKRENSKSYLFDWSYYNGVVFEGIEYLYEVTGESVYRDYVVEYMSSMITSAGGWATCSNNSSKQAAGYNSTHGADCYKTASLLMDCYQMTGDSRYLTMAKTLYGDLDSAANSYLLKNAGYNFRHTWASDPSPDLWLDGLYMILPFRAEYARYIGDTEELNLIVSRMQWVSDNMYNSSRKLFYHAADSASSNSGTYWLRSIGWYAAAIVDIMDSMEGANLETMKKQLVKLVDGMKACQNASNGMWLNNMAASQSSSNPYETSGTALVCYAVMKAVNNGWLDESYADMAILAFNGICGEKLSGSTLKDICFKGVPSGSNSTFYNNEGKGVGPFIMLYAEILEYVNQVEEEPEVTEPEVTEPEVTEPEVTEPEVTEPEVTEPEVTEPEVTEPEATEPSEPEEEQIVYTGSGNLEGGVESVGAAVSSISSGTYYYLVNTKANKTLTSTVSGSRLTMSGSLDLANVNRWYITQVSGNTYYVQYGGPNGKYLTVGNDSAALTSTPTALTLTYDNANSCWDIGSGNYHLNDYRAEHNYASGYTVGSSSDNGSRWAFYPVVTVTTYYELDTNGIDYGSEHKYLIVSNDQAVALKPNGSNTTTQAVSIQNGIITNATADLEWYFIRNSSKTGSTTYDTLITQNGTTWLYHTNSNMYIGNGSDAHRGYWYLDNSQNGSYCFGDQDYNIWYLYHNGSAFTVRSNNTSTYVRLFRKVDAGIGEQVIFTLSPASTLVKPGSTLALNGTVTVDGQSVNLSSCTITWSSSDNSVAAVSGGNVTAAASGNATITATLSAVNGTSLKENIVLTVPVTVQGHDYKAVITAPTCTEKGYTTYTCSICGDSYVADEVAALGHSYESVTTEATCTENGSVVYTCHCGDSYTEVIPATGHAYKAVVTAPTCVDAGYTTYTCACGHSYVADEVDALGHDNESVITEATCETEGFTTHTCRVCGEVTVDTIVEALGHAYETVTIEPTCTEAGSVTKTCGRCGDSHTEEIAALGHKYEAVVTAPACETEGYTTYTCECGESYVADRVAALGHDYKSVITEATCTEDGSTVYTCHCGDTYTEVIAALGHKYEAVVTAPTCVDAGYTTYTCACGDTYVADEVAALGHKYEAVVTAPTCEKPGYTTYTCACGDTYVADEVAALGHKYEAVVTAPTCEKPGYTTYTCDCGHSYTADEVAALGHDYASVTTEPTCTEDGSIVYTCACGDSYTEVIEALGHDYKTVVTAPSCESEGYTTYTCHCGNSYVADKVAALGHDYESVTTEATCTEDGSIVYTCHCGDTYTEVIAALGHDYASVTTEATCTEDGSIVYTCHCGDTYTEVIATLGHDYESVTTEPTCTEDGSIVYTCHCGDTYTEVIAALGHKYEAVVTVPTCENAGFTTYTCHCGDTYIADEVAALGHTYDVVVTAPTCTEAGFTTYTCDCGHSYTADEVAALGHDYASVTTEPTCTEDGSIVYTCHCGDTYTEVIAALGHKYEAKVTAPTCENDGYTTYTCSCGDSYVANKIAALGHSYNTVEQNGVLVHTCAACGHSYTESVAWITVGSGYVLDTDGIEVGQEHKYIIVGADKNYALTLNGSTVSATAVTIQNNVLVIDDASKMEFWFADNGSREKNTYLLTQDGSQGIYHVGGNINYGHDSKGYWYFGSASNGQYQLYDFDNLNWYLNYGYVWGSDAVSRFAVSSNARSVRLFKASDSYARLTGDLIQTVADTDNATVASILEKISVQLSANGSDVTGTAAVTSDMLSWNAAFDGTMPGTYTAEVIYQGVSLGTITVNVTSVHTYVTTVVAPTCESQGYSERKCSECGISQKYDYTAALGHSYTYADSNGYRVYTCVRCGDSYSEVLAPAYSQVSAFTSGERFVITVKSGSKYYALSHSGNNISAVQVTVSNGEITSDVSEDLLWSYDDGKLSYVSGGTTYYLYSYSSGWWWWTSPAMGISSGQSSQVSLTSSKLKIGDYYLRYSSSNFSANSSGTTVYLFQEK